MTLTQRGSLWTFSANLALCVLLCCDTRHWTPLYLYALFFLPLSFRLLLQRANKKPRELSKRPRRSFPSRHLPSSSVTCRYDIRLPCSGLHVRRPRSDGRQARLVCRIGRMKGLFIDVVIHVWFVLLWLLTPLSFSHITKIFHTLLLKSHLEKDCATQI